MSTEVGSLQANLTLDMSNFRSGMDEAARLASALGAQLREAFGGNTGLSDMAYTIFELAAQIEGLRAAISDFQAAMATTTGTDMFTQMKTHTASLHGEIASISSELNNITTAFNNVSSNGTLGLNFSSALGQLQQIQGTLSSIIAQIQQANNIDLSTGEVLGDVGQVPAIATMFTNFQQINSEISTANATMTQLVQTTSTWSNEISKVHSSVVIIANQLQKALDAMRGIGSSGSAKGTRKLVNETGRASKNLQTAKGYAVSVKGILGGIVISQAFYSLLNTMEELVQGSIKFSQNMQDAGVAFKYLMEGAEVSSGAFLNALKDIALQSPLDTTDLTSSARKLMAMGFSAEATVPALRILTDTAAVFSNSAGDMSDMIDHISLAFGQMIASGKVSAQELRQLYNAGLPIYDLLAEGLGISKQMAKNIGHYNIDSASAVFAVLDQLQKRYGGAAAEMATTMSGALEVIRESIQQLLSYGWSDIFNTITQKLNVVAKFAQALVKITQAYGPGGLFQAIFPPASWTTLRQLLGGFQMLGHTVKQVGQILAQSFGGALQLIAGIGSVVVPIVSTLANTILFIARMALSASPALRVLMASMVALMIASVVGKVILFLSKAIYMLSGAKYAIAALKTLGRTLVAFTGWSKGAVIAAMAIAAALLAIVASSEKARAALAKFFGGAVSKFNDFSQQLGMGFDPGKVAMPEFEMPDTADFSGGIEDMSNAMDQLEDSADKAGKAAKKAKKNIQSFDEVYNIDTSEDDGSSGAGDAIDSMMDSLKNLGNLDYSNLFDWTGDWATDWGNLTAGIGDMNTDLMGSLTDVGTAMAKFWNDLTGGDDFKDAMAVFDVLSAILALLGKTEWAGALQVVEGLSKISKALADMSADGINWENINLLVSGLGDIVIGLGIITKTPSVIGIGVMIQGLADISESLRTIVTDGIDFEGILGIISGMGKIVIGLGVLKGNMAAISGGLAITGLSTILAELAENWAAIRQGDWSGVDKVALIIGGLETLGGLILALKTFSTLKKAANTAETVKDIADTATTVGQMDETLSGGGGGASGKGGKGGGLNGNLASFAKNLGLGIAIMAEVAAAAALFVGAMWLIGKELEQVAIAWQPVVDNGQTVLIALGAGTLLLGAIGVATAALGTLGGAMCGQIAIGIAVLAELGVATGLFLAEIWGIGYLLDQIRIAWQPVLDNGETVATAIALGTALLVGVGVVTAALGVATVATAGLLPAAIGLGTAILVELAVAVVALIDSIVDVATELNDNLAPVLEDINGKLPTVTSHMSNFVTFMKNFATEVYSYTKSMGKLTWSSIVQGFQKFFSGNPIGSLAKDIKTIKNDTTDLNKELKPAVSELRTAISLMEDYNKFMNQLRILTEENKATTLKTGMLTNLKEVGKALVTGLIDGIKDKTPDAKKEVQNLGKSVENEFKSSFTSTKFNTYGKDTVQGLIDGISNNTSALTTKITTLATTVKNTFNSFFTTSGFTSYGKNIIQGVIDGISGKEKSLENTLTTSVNDVAHKWFKKYFDSEKFETYGKNIITGMCKGVDDNRDTIDRKVAAICRQIRQTIQRELEIHSPSRFTEWCGKMLMSGWSNGIVSNLKAVMNTATDASHKLTAALQPEESTPNDLLDASTLSSVKTLNALSTWAHTFTNILTTTFNGIADMFDNLTARITAATFAIQNTPTAINSRMGSLAAVEGVVETTRNTHTTGTSQIMRVLADLTEDTLSKLSDRIAIRIYEYLAPLFADMSVDDQDRIIAYIGTLIADDQGLKMLERKLYDIRQVNQTRR